MVQIDTYGYVMIDLPGLGTVNVPGCMVRRLESNHIGVIRPGAPGRITASVAVRVGETWVTIQRYSSPDFVQVLELSPDQLTQLEGEIVALWRHDHLPGNGYTDSMGGYRGRCRSTPYRCRAHYWPR